MYGQPPAMPGKKKPMPFAAKKPAMLADGDMGSPADMEAPSDTPPDDEQGEAAGMDMINSKLDKIMAALGIEDEGAEGDMPEGAEGEPPAMPGMGMPGGGAR